MNVETLAVAALEAPRCTCGSNIASEGECIFCGREVRTVGSLARDFRRAACVRRLAWARGAGVCPRTGFRGLSHELGPNPDLTALDAALEARVAALPPLDGDLMLGGREPAPLALVA